MGSVPGTEFELPRIPNLRCLPEAEVHRLHKDIVLIAKLRKGLVGTRLQIEIAHQSVIDSVELLDRIKRDGH